MKYLCRIIVFFMAYFTPLIIIFPLDSKIYHGSESKTLELALLENEEDSLILIKGCDTIFSEHFYENVRGIPTKINWNKIPDFGFPKYEIKSIEIVKRAIVLEEEGAIILIPSEWVFRGECWSKNYHGEIPYLENLEFLDTTLKEKISTKITMIPEQNDLGYFQDKKTGKTGFYDAIQNISNNTINKILIISAKENKEILKQNNSFDIIK